MNQVTIEELEQLKDKKIIILDVRREEDYNRGTFEGARNLPIEDFSVEAYQKLLEKEGFRTSGVSFMPYRREKQGRGGTVRVCRI